MIEYPKINTIWKRDDRGRILVGEYATPELDYLAGLNWAWTEKVDGTNIRVGWDGANVRIGGRTDNAQIPTRLLDYLGAALRGALLAEHFPDATAESPVVLFGEGYGAGIQKGGVYRPDQSFVLFDVRVGTWWLRRDDVAGVGRGLGIDVVPEVAVGPILMAHTLVRDDGLRSAWDKSLVPEGLVGRPVVELFDRKGERIMTKIKARDYKEIAVRA